MASLTASEEALFIDILNTELRERVAPKFEAWREPADFKVAHGGRGAGAKSWSVASLLVQKLQAQHLKCFCGREIQKTLEESSYSLIWDTISRLGYEADWEAIPSRSRIVNKKNGSYFYFAGLKDLKTAKGLKGLEGYDLCWIDEAESIPVESWDLIFPTFRKAGSEIWITFNRDKDMDPVYKLFYINPPPNTIALELKPGKEDNPWFPDKLLTQMKHDYAVRPDIAEHKWGGKPKAQGFNAVMSRVAVRAAMNRRLPAEGPFSCGVDVARFGDDRTVMYLRQGMKVIDSKILHGANTQRVAKEVWSFVKHKKSTTIKIDDTGVGGGVTDRLREFGAKVVPINFGSSAVQKKKYKNLATEMWFELPIDEIDIPDDDELMDELSERLYDYDKTEAKIIEPKKDFKERYGKSPDKADALILCFFTGKTIQYTPKAKRALAARRGR